MSVPQNVSVMTAQLRSNFFLGWQETAETADYKSFTTTVGSTTRIENYFNMTPAPSMERFHGVTNYGSVSSYIYSLENWPFRVGLRFDLDDWDDDQSGGLAKKPKELAVKGQKKVSRELFKCLAAGVNGTYKKTGEVYGATFDTQFYFANRTGANGFGTGNNLLSTFTTADHTSGSATANTTYNLVALYHGPECGDLLPMLWQNRAGVKFRTNVGTWQSEEANEVRMFAHMRGRAGFGIWQWSVLQPILGLPNTSEMHTIYAAIENAYRTFQLPKSKSSAEGEYVFEQVKFSDSNLMFAASTGLSEALRTSLQQDLTFQAVGTTVAAATSNRFKGFAAYTLSAYLNDALT